MSRFTFAINAMAAAGALSRVAEIDLDAVERAHKLGEPRRQPKRESKPLAISDDSVPNTRQRRRALARQLKKSPTTTQEGR